MDINLKRNEELYIVSEDYRHHTILACYANNILIYKNDNIKVVYKEYSKISKFDRNLECSIYKCKDMIERG